MDGLIWLVGQVSHNTALYGWSFAFVFSEMAGSLEWQLGFWLVRVGVLTSKWQIHLFMAAAYACCTPLKCSGALEVKQEEDWFTVTAMIPIAES